MMRVLIGALVVFAACDEPGGRGGAVDIEVGDLGAEITDPDVTSPDVTSPDVTPDEVAAETVVPPQCIDERYDEVLPNDRADLSGLLASYSEADYLTFADAVLDARYPFGAFLVREANAGGAGGLGNCITAFARNRDSASDLIGDLSTVVHECGHLYDLDRGGFASDYYQIADGVVFECNRGDTNDGRGGDTFARSRLNGDNFAPAYPDDFYRDVYLDGNPDDGSFDSGDQGFNSVLEEATQYINSLATDWALRDQLRFSISARDGLLTFLWYIERYLHMARNQFPSAYARLSGDACWRQAILTVWGRGWFYLDLTADIQQLGIDDDTIERLVLTPELLNEIDLIRQLECP